MTPKQLLKEKFHIPDNKTINESVDVKNFSYEKMRDIMNAIGGIILEDKESQICLANVKSGFFNMSDAVLAVQFSDDKLLFSAYAEEGIINQRTAEKAIEEFLKSIKDSL